MDTITLEKERFSKKFRNNNYYFEIEDILFESTELKEIVDIAFYQILEFLKKQNKYISIVIYQCCYLSDIDDIELKPIITAGFNFIPSLSVNQYNTYTINLSSDEK